LGFRVMFLLGYSNERPTEARNPQQPLENHCSEETQGDHQEEDGGGLTPPPPPERRCWYSY